jgi:hypothetical protein
MNQHLKINYALALAIGWREDDILPYEGILHVDIGDGLTRKFDYRDPNVIWPIARKFNAFPYRITLKEGGSVGKWNCFCETGRDNVAATPEKAVAMAVINRSRK